MSKSPAQQHAEAHSRQVIVLEGTPEFRSDDGGMSYQLELIDEKQSRLFIRIMSWEEDLAREGELHPELTRLKGKRLRVTIEAREGTL